MDTAMLMDLATNPATTPLLLVAGLIAATFLSEDAAIIGAAVLAGKGLLAPPLAFLAVNAGILAGDAGLYGLGSLAARQRRLRALVATRRVRRARTWLKGRLTTVLIGTRFVPGTRLPTYTACGFFGLSFTSFMAVLSVASLAWTGFVFAVILSAGIMAFDVLGPWKWLGVAVILSAAMTAPRILGRRWAASVKGTAT